jgi:capsular exopolysaccharide synthesis family protein
MVLVSVEHSDPRLAQELANTLVAEYKEENLEYKRRVVSEAILELRSMMLRLRQDKEEARARVLEFERRYSMSSLESRQEQVADQLKQLGTEYLSSVIQRADVESSREREELSTRIAEMAALLDSKDYSDVSHPVLVNSSSIITLKLRLVDLDTEVRKTAGRYGPKHPIMQAAYAQRSLVRKALLKESRILLESELKSSKDLLEKENNKLHKAIEMEQKLLVELNDSKEEESRLAKLQLDYRPLRDRANEAGKLFEDVKARYTETTLSAQVETNNVRIQDLATMPIDPVRPNKKLNVSLGLLVGLMLGIGAAYFVETLDSSLKTREDIEATGKVDFLGIVPAVDDLVAPDPTNINKSTELFAFHHPKASVSENIRTIKTNLFFSRPGGRPSRILVTSPGPKEGKTTVGCNLAAVAAMAGARTLVVDTDMRRPRVHRLFGIPRRPGVTEFLMGSMPISSFCRPTPVEGLDVLTCGTLAPNPLEVLESKKFWQMVDELSTLYDIVVFDSPPLLAVADAKIICSSVDVVVLVVRAGQTTKEGLREARGMLYPMVDEDVGVVLNGFDAERHSYRYYYYRSKAYTYYNYYSYEDSGADSETGVQEEDSVRSASWGKRSA